MIDSTQETEGKSPGISERESEGVAGPSREVSQRDQIVSGAENAGQEENSELEWAKRHVKEEPAPVKQKPVTQEPVPQPVRNVFRKTELHGTTPASIPDECKKTRKRTMQSLESPGVMESYHPFEVAFKDFICSLMEHQDMMGEDLLLHFADLQQQIDALKDKVNKVKKTESSSNPEAKLWT
jgi:hypothetical protein